jgi:ribosomal protein L7Ae-like RNA K-turn-binding protein
MAKSQKYTGAMEQVLRDEAIARDGLNLEACKEIAGYAAFIAADATPRSIVAKVRSMGLPYAKVERTTKTGEPVAKKDEIVTEIEQVLGVTGLDSLAKAEKPALRELLAAVQERMAQVA